MFDWKTALLFLVPIVALVGSVAYCVRLVRRGAAAKSAVCRQLCMFLAVGAVCCLVAATTASAADLNAAPAGDTAAVADTGSAAGMGYLAAAVVTGLSGIGGGIAVAAAAPAAIGATSEDPKTFGKALIFVALGEGIALYGLLVSILILNKV